MLDWATSRRPAELEAARTPLTASATSDAGAAMLAELVWTLAEVDRLSVIQFYRLLGHHLAFDGKVPSRAREAQLGLLMSLVASGELPPRSRYEQARTAEARTGVSWPSGSALGDVFGSYPRAVDVAVRYLAPTDRRSTPRRWSTAPSRTYSREEILAKIEACRLALATESQARSGWYPDAHTFFLWNSIGREAARKAGAQDPRLPSKDPVRRWFGSYEDAVEACRRHKRLVSLPPSTSGSRPRPRRPRSRRVEV